MKNIKLLVIALSLLTSFVFSPSARAEWEARIDFASNASAPVGNWNTVSSENTPVTLTEWNTGVASSAQIVGAGWDAGWSGSVWNGGTVDWVNNNAASDLFYWGGGTEDDFQFTLSGLDSQKSYQVEIVSSDSANNVVSMITVGGTYADNNYQGGATETELQNWRGDDAYNNIDWLIWDAVVPDAGGSLLLIANTQGGAGYAEINAMRIFEVGVVPEPTTTGLLGIAVLVLFFKRRFYTIR